MTRRRATYNVGGGLLLVDQGRLLFVEVADHEFVPALVAAASSGRALRSLAAAVGSADCDVPPFVFVQEDEELRGMVFGGTELELGDSERSVVRGEGADTWNQFLGSASSGVSVGDDGDEGLWVEVGVVRADAFRWVVVEDSASAVPSSRRAQRVPDDVGGTPMPSAGVEDAAEPSAGERAQPEPSEDPDVSGLGDGIRGAGASEPSVSDRESGDDPVRVAAVGDAGAGGVLGGDPTLVASRFGVTPAASAAEHRSRVSALAERLAARRATTTAEQRTRPRDPHEPRGSGVPDGPDTDSTLDLEPSEIVLDELAQRRTVEAIVCLDCGHPGPPFVVRCGACGVSVVDGGGEIRVIAQPALGEIRLSGDRVELLDMDLLIGRNPAREPIEPHQRAVIHGTGDRSVSRRHIELRLDGWRVVVTTLKADDQTIVESRRGHVTPLQPGVSRTLEAGDTVRYGGCWFRYEEGS